jgi:hypothetical protein
MLNIIELDAYPTSYTNADHGKFHPAIRRAHKPLLIWWNITKDNEDDAAEFARLALKDASKAAQTIVNQWNVQPL